MLDDNVTGEIPVPETLAACGLLVPSSFTFKEAVREPVPPGEKITLIVQLPEGPRLPPQLLVWEKSPLLVPLNVILVMFSVTLCAFTSVRFCGLLLLPTVWLPKVRLRGDSVGLPQPGTAKLAIRVPHEICEPIWFAGKYWFTYQKVQPSSGSTVILE